MLSGLSTDRKEEILHWYDPFIVLATFRRWREKESELKAIIYKNLSFLFPLTFQDSVVGLVILNLRGSNLGFPSVK